MVSQFGIFVPHLTNRISPVVAQSKHYFACDTKQICTSEGKHLSPSPPLCRCCCDRRDSTNSNSCSNIVLYTRLTQVKIKKLSQTPKLGRDRSMESIMSWIDQSTINKMRALKRRGHRKNPSLKLTKIYVKKVAKYRQFGWNQTIE